MKTNNSNGGRFWVLHQKGVNKGTVNVVEHKETEEQHVHGGFLFMVDEKFVCVLFFFFFFFFFFFCLFETNLEEGVVWHARQGHSPNCGGRQE